MSLKTFLYALIVQGIVVWVVYVAVKKLRCVCYFICIFGSKELTLRVYSDQIVRFLFIDA